jgi:hypothetical protein
MKLEIINKLFFELSQVATAFTHKELNLERIPNEALDERHKALKKLAEMTQCAEEMLRCFEAGEHFGALSDYENSDNETWDARCEAACVALKAALTENKLYLELSQVATATTQREIQLERIITEHRDGRLAALEKLAKMEAQRDAWKAVAEFHYEDTGYTGLTLNAWAAERYPAIKEALNDSPG